MEGISSGAAGKRSQQEELRPIIQAATADDWQEFKRIRTEALSEDPESFGDEFAEVAKKTDDQWRHAAEDPDEPVFLATEGGKAVGMVSIWERTDRKKIWNIISLYVSAAHRGKNLGSDLINRAEEEIKKRGGKQAVLYFRRSKDELRRLYERAGFHASAAQDYEIWERMEKELSNKG